MIPIPFLIRRRLLTPCTIEIEHSETSLHAHVDLDSGIALRPGDRVRVHGAPIRVVFGDKLTLRRDATVERAGWLERQWTRIAARFELSELYDVSFTPGRLP
ncbi:hypothetical protein [Phenylobacterium sp.]|uniref:hypothetical protein n=1 Tax=Phenylobacterium sp. TaxID=1871053 RepID=UPI0025DE0C94|nr:hypothetical protein [Phenylobacterium sp.]